MQDEKAIRLDRRPEVRAFTVEKLLLEMKAGRIRVPEFRRPLVWLSSHVLALFDTMYRGFPVGTLLFSRGPAEAAKFSFGPVWVDAPAMGDALFVLDGQQRMTALAAAMLHPDRQPRGDTFAVWFDLEKERFVQLTSAAPPLTWIPLNVAGNHRALANWFAEWPLRAERPDLRERAFHLNDILERYEIPAYIVEHASKEVLGRIFMEVSGIEVHEGDAHRGSSIRGAIARLHEETGFGSIDGSLYLRCLKAVKGIDPRTTLREIDDETLQRTETALRLALSFLIEDAGIPHIRLLPYRLPLIVLARLFALHPEPDARARRLLVFWVWRGALSGAHTRVRSAAAHELQACLDADLFSSIARLLLRVPKPRQIQLPGWGDLDGSETSPLSRACMVALLHVSPRDPSTGEEITRERVQAWLDQGEIGLSDVVDRVSGALWTTLPLEPRREIHDRIEQFFLRKMGNDEDDRPSIREIVRRVDDLAVSR